MESYILAACKEYEKIGLARIVKVYEPFKVLTLNKSKNRFTGLFLENAEPDFLGTLLNGMTIAFESKYTEKDRIQQSVISDQQWKSLDGYQEMNAVVGVCVGINKTYAFVPWHAWKNMKNDYGRKYMTADEVKKYQVSTPGYINFLERICG